MKIKFKYKGVLSTLMLAIMVLITACEEEVEGPELVPIRAEIKQVIVNNSVYSALIQDDIRTDDVDSVIVTVPQGTDVSNLDLDILYSYFGTISPEPGVTDLTNPVKYTVTSNVESRDYLVIAEVIPPRLESFLITSPASIPVIMQGDSLLLDVQEGVNLSTVEFIAEFFGESIQPTQEEVLDLTVDNPTIKVINQGFETVYTFYVSYYKNIEFTGAIFDCTVHPNDFIAGAISADDAAFFTVVDDETSVLGGKVNRFTNLAYDGNTSGSASFYFDELGLDPAESDVVTVIFRAKGISTDSPDRYAEMTIGLGDWRVQFWPESDQLDASGVDGYSYADDPYGLDPLNWNIYRITCNTITGEVRVYVNENSDPIEALNTSMEPRAGEGYRVRFGDGSGGNNYDGLYDYIIVESSGAYSPEDLPLSKILGEE